MATIVADVVVGEKTEDLPPGPRRRRGHRQRRRV